VITFQELYRLGPFLPFDILLSLCLHSFFSVANGEDVWGGDIIDGISRRCNSIHCRELGDRVDGSVGIPCDIKICAGI
jgi:hypothetical protein